MCNNVAASWEDLLWRRNCFICVLHSIYEKLSQNSYSYFVLRLIVFLCSKIIDLFLYPLLTCGSVLSVSWKRGVFCIYIAFMWQVVGCDNNDIITT